MGIGTVIGVAIFFVAVAGLIGLGIDQWLTGLSYERDMGGLYTYADSASDASTKASYFDKWVSAIQTQGLNKGYSSVFYQTQPTANLANTWNVTKSLQNRLDTLATMDQNSMQYQQGLQEVSMTEMCYYPEQVYQQAYLLNHGLWWTALTPPLTDTNNCAESHSHN